MSKNKSNIFSFLSPLSTIKEGHLTKHDVKSIKVSLSHKMGIASLVVASILLLLNIIMLVSMGIETGWHQFEIYGIPSFLSQAITIVGTLGVIALEIISLKSKTPIIKDRCVHFANLLVYLVLAAGLFLSLYADASKGFLSKSPTLSPALTLISFLIIIQPVFWREAAILDGAVSIGLVFLSIYATNVYKIEGLMYYLFIAIVFPIASYLIICILFYAETQRYCEELRNEALHNTAMYDELTLCKNRYALKESLNDYAKRWGNNQESLLLVMMFDIDDFKLYNDQFSHIGGDYCLKSIADAVRKTFPSPTLDFYRYGGEEFLLFMEVNSQTQAQVIVEKIRIAIKNLGIMAAKGAPCDVVTISVGGTCVKANEITDFNEIIQIADKYLYQAKGKGKNISILDGALVTPSHPRQ